MAERNCLDNFGKGPYEEHLSDIILKFGQAVQLMLFNEFSNFSSGGHFVWQSRTVWAILEEGLGEITMKLGHQFRRCCLKCLFFLSSALVAILFDDVEPFGQFW